eukprot:357000-Chlamydomonas_euryale.AAC.13
MVEEVRRQFVAIPGLMEGAARPDYKRCVEISTASSLSEMVAPGALVMVSPIAVGALFGTQALAGMLVGGLVSGMQLAVSMSNTGGAWDNAKKYIEAGNTPHARELGPKGSECHKSAVIGDTVGDPLKDASGPSLNILVKLMAVESLVARASCSGGPLELLGQACAWSKEDGSWRAPYKSRTALRAIRDCLGTAALAANAPPAVQERTKPPLDRSHGAEL